MATETMSHVNSSHPLDAVPVRSEGILRETHPQEGCLLRLLLKPQGFVHRWMARWMGRQEIRIILDLRGSRFWELIDDRRSLREISHQLARELDVSEKECRDACARYTADLVRRGFLHLSISGNRTE